VSELEQAIQVLKEGGIIAHYTDTVLGLACDAKNPDAVKKLNGLKQRPADKSFLILVDSEGMLQNHVPKMPEIAWDLIDSSEKPLTIVYDEVKNIADGIKASDGSVGVRLTKHSLTKKLIRGIKGPLVSSSANLSGEKAATLIVDLSPKLSNKIDFILNLDEPSAESSPSSIIKLKNNGEIKIIRE
jgi:L-threonylcarbamoyladenylate synthase